MTYLYLPTIALCLLVLGAFTYGVFVLALDVWARSAEPVHGGRSWDCKADCFWCAEEAA